MSKSADTGRVILDEAAKTAVNEMLTMLKSEEDCIRLNSSKLVSWIVTRFKASRFEHEQSAIIKAHFNSKEYLKKAVSQSATEADLSEALETVLTRMNSRADIRRSRRKKQSKMIGSAELNTENPNVTEMKK